MPTIHELEPVVVAADDDELPVSQGGIVRRVSRAQLLAGVQSALSLAPGLLGRFTPGSGRPERVQVGTGLSLVNGVLAGSPPFSISSLPVTASANATDLVPVSHAGRDTAITVANLLSSAALDLSSQTVTARVGQSRSLRDWMSDDLAVESFGASGDGMTDDTAAFNRAIASGKAVRLAAKTYRIDGQWTVTSSATLIGVTGATTLLRGKQNGGAWILLRGASFIADGIIFDAGASKADSWGVLVAPSCATTVFENCTFENVAGPTLGTGLTIQARSASAENLGTHTIKQCVFRQNAMHGLWIQAASQVLVEGCSAFDNAQFGICLDYNDPSFALAVSNSSVLGCRTWRNQRGISVGNYNETNAEPPRWGLANPDARDIIVTDNTCFDNASYGIAVSGSRIQVRTNIIMVGGASGDSAGILLNAIRSCVSGNIVSGPGQYGIDAGGCVDCDIAGNLIQGCSVGINGGGGQGVVIASNRLSSNARAITIFSVETDGAGHNFGLFSANTVISDNSIELIEPDDVGISLVDGPQSVDIRGNRFVAPTRTAMKQALAAHSDSVALFANTWNGQSTGAAEIVVIGTQAYLSAPEIADTIVVKNPPTLIAGLVGSHARDVLNQITFIQVISGGTGFSVASVIIGGSGSNAQAIAYLRDGVVIGITIVSGGSGYTASDTTVTVTGDGRGCAARAFVGLPISQGRRLTLQTPSDMILQNTASLYPFASWTRADRFVPGQSEVRLAGDTDRWMVVSSFAADYLRPISDGSISLVSRTGDVRLSPGGGGSVRVLSADEPTGFVTCCGRGAPEGVVSAPAGSDYRNLDGGQGSTLWIKQSGTSSSGWIVIA